MERGVLASRPMRRTTWVAGGGLAVAIALLACGSGKMPAPRYVGQPSDALLPADYPPPPARVEFIPDEPKKNGAVWIDGEWTWQGKRWGWKPGRWVVAPENASYSPWTAVRDARGRLLVAEGKWRDANGKELPDPQPLAIGRPSAGTVVSPEGEEVPAAPNVPPTTPPKKPGQPGGAGSSGAPETPSQATPTGTFDDHGPTGGDSGPASDAGAPTDAGAADVVVHDAVARPDAMPLGGGDTARDRSPRMIAP